MSKWNYRFCVETVPDGIGGTEDVWTVREIYYDDKGNALKREFLASPLKFTRISSGFGFKAAICKSQ